MSLNRDRLVYESFRTPAGLEPQAALEHASAYAQAQGQAAQLDQRTNGLWRDVPFSNGVFSTDSVSSLIVTKGNVLTYRYRIIGPELHLKFLFTGLMFGSSASWLRLAYPEGLRGMAGVYSDSTGFATDAGGNFITLLYGAPGVPYLQIGKTDFSHWRDGGVVVRGQTVIEVQ